MDRCPVSNCDTAGQGCTCTSGTRTFGTEIGQMTMINDTFFYCAVSDTSVTDPGLYLVAVCLNGQDCSISPNSTAVLFFENPRLVDALTLSGSRLNFGVGNIGQLGGSLAGFAAAAESEAGSTLVAFLAEPACIPGTGNVACILRVSASGSCQHQPEDGQCRGRSASPALRFVPGTCKVGDPCPCESSPITRDAPLTFWESQASGRTEAPTKYAVLKGTVPSSGSGGRLGLHYVCFTVDGSNYSPILPQVLVLNDEFTLYGMINLYQLLDGDNGPTDATWIQHFLFYNITVQSVSIDQVTISICSKQCWYFETFKTN